MTSLPTLYLSHGSPMIALEPGAAGAFMQRLGPAITRRFGKPRAILALSAHTLVREPTLLAGPHHEAVYDFGGFPDALYRLRYDAPGAPGLASQVQGLMAAAGLSVHRVEEGGLDHGIWTPLRYLYPEADVPVLPLGWVPTWSPERLFTFGQALRPLVDDGVLIIGSGSLTHNLRLVFGAQRPPAVDAPEIEASAAFRAWIAARAAAADWPAMFAYRQQAPHAVQMHPSDEHWLPWYPAAGAAAGAAAGSAQAAAAGPVGMRLHDSVTFGCLAMDSYAFGPAAGDLLKAL
jgi:4,5-DOPA dioxygenase extradiol